MGKKVVAAVEVARCGDCPFFRHGKYGNYCRKMKIKRVVKKSGIDKNCPLPEVRVEKGGIPNLLKGRPFKIRYY